MEMEKGSHFVLVHGSCHGAWCWYNVAALLKSAGHKATALDLAASGNNPKQANQVRSLLDYVEPLTDFMDSLPPEEKVILVAHSLGGASISIAMERFPQKISVAVFATAVMPGPQFSFLAIGKEFDERIGSFMDTQYFFDNGQDNPPTSLLFGPEFMASKLYNLSPVEDLRLALSLIRPQPIYGDVQQLMKDSELTPERYGSVPRVFIMCDQDKASGVELQRLMIEKTPPNEVKMISGSNHMVPISKPQELSSILQEIAAAYS